MALLVPRVHASSPCVVDEAGARACWILTVAGSGAPDVGDGGLAVAATLESPWAVLAAADGSIYIADTLNNRVRRIRPDGVIETVAGTGSAETQDLGDGAPASQARLRFPRGLAFGPDGSLCIADTNHYVIRRVTPDGIITTVAGNRNFVFSGEGVLATQASFASPAAVAVDGQGNVYIADMGAHRVRRVGPDGVIHTAVGTGQPGADGDGGPAIRARITAPMSLAIDPRGGLVIGGTGPGRRVDLATGIIATVAAASGPHVAVGGDGDLYFSSQNRVFRLDSATGAATVIAGTGQPGFRGDGGPALDAWFDFPAGLTVDAAGNVYIADVNNNRVRRVRSDGRIETVAGTGRQGSSGDGGPPLHASFSQPRALAFDARGNLFVIDETHGTGTVRRISPGSTGVIGGAADEAITTVAGRTAPREQADHGAADGGPAREAVFSGARGIAVDSRGTLYVADWLDDRVRSGVPGRDGVVDGGAGEVITTVVAAPTITRPNWLAVDGSDNLYVLEERGVIRRIDAVTGAVTTVAADLGPILSFAVDPDGTLYIPRADQVLRLAAGTGELALLAGTGETGFAGDGGDARAARLRGAGFIARDVCGDLYVADNGNYRIRRVWLAFVAHDIPVGLCGGRTSVRPGETLRIDVAVANPGAAAAVDVHLGVLAPASAAPAFGCPSGDAVLLFEAPDAMPRPVCLAEFPAGFVPLVPAAEIPAALPATAYPDAVALVWPDALPAGTYAFFLVLTRPGAFVDGQVDPGDILGLATTPVTRP